MDSIGKVLSVRRLAAAGILVVVVACGGRGGVAPPGTSDASATLSEFMAAVKSNDLETMGRLWGTERGPATTWMDPDELRKRLATIQVYLAHRDYRVLGPQQPEGGGIRQAYRIELHRANRCIAMFPIELVLTRRRTWVVIDVNLDQVGNPARSCPEQ